MEIASVSKRNGKFVEEGYAAVFISGEFEPETMMINGGVFGLNDKAPVSGATVDVGFIESGSTFTTSTDNDGLFSIGDLTEAGL